MEDHMVFKKHHSPERVYKSTRRKTIMFGILLVTFGIFWMLNKLQMLDPMLWKAVYSWQALVIGIGLINIVNGHARFFGFLLILAGAFFMTMKLDILPEMYSDAFWPALIIIVGLAIIFSRRRIFHKRVRVSNSNNNSFEEIAVFGGSERKINSLNFTGGEAVAVFGGSVIDLSSCKLAPGTHKIDLVAVFGGIKLIVPPDWNIKTNIVNILGGISDKRDNNLVNPDSLIIIEGVAIFGGGEITIETE